MQLTLDQIDALKELVNIGVGLAASMLNKMIDTRITLEIPYIQALDAAQLQQELTKKFDNDCFAAVRQSYTGSICGNAS